MLVPTKGLTFLKPGYLFSHQAQKQSRQWSEEGGSFLLHKVLGVVAWNLSWSSDNLLRRQISRTTLGCAHLGNLARTLLSAIFKPQPCLKPLTWDVVVWGGALSAWASHSATSTLKDLWSKGQLVLLLGYAHIQPGSHSGHRELTLP